MWTLGEYRRTFFFLCTLSYLLRLGMGFIFGVQLHVPASNKFRFNQLPRTPSFPLLQRSSLLSAIPSASSGISSTSTPTESTTLRVLNRALSFLQQILPNPDTSSMPTLLKKSDFVSEAEVIHIRFLTNLDYEWLSEISQLIDERVQVLKLSASSYPMGFQVLSNITTTRPSSSYVMSNPSPSILDFLAALDIIHVKWSKLSKSSRISLEPLLSSLLARKFHPRTHLSVVLLMGSLKVDFAELSFSTQQQFKDVLMQLVHESHPMSSSHACSLIACLGSMKVGFYTDLNEVEGKILKVFTMKHLQRSLLSYQTHSQRQYAGDGKAHVDRLEHQQRRITYFNAISGLSHIGFRWNKLDVKARKIIEAVLRQSFDAFGGISSSGRNEPVFTHNPRDIVSFLLSLSNMQVKWPSTDRETQIILERAIMYSLPSMSAKQLSNVLTASGDLEVNLNSLDGLQELVRTQLQSLSSSMQSWELVQTLLALGKLKASPQLIFDSGIVTLIIKKARFIGPTSTADLMYAVGLLMSSKSQLYDDKQTCKLYSFDAQFFSLLQVLSTKWVPRMKLTDFSRHTLGLLLIASHESFDTNHHFPGFGMGDEVGFCDPFMDIKDHSVYHELFKPKVNADTVDATTKVDSFPPLPPTSATPSVPTSPSQPQFLLIHSKVRSCLRSLSKRQMILFMQSLMACGISSTVLLRHKAIGYLIEDKVMGFFADDVSQKMSLSSDTISFASPTPTPTPRDDIYPLSASYAYSLLEMTELLRLLAYQRGSWSSLQPSSRNIIYSWLEGLALVSPSKPLSEDQIFPPPPSHSNPNPPQPPLASISSSASHSVSPRRDVGTMSITSDESDKQHTLPSGRLSHDMRDGVSLCLALGLLRVPLTHSLTPPLAKRAVYEYIIDLLSQGINNDNDDNDDRNGNDAAKILTKTSSPPLQLTCEEYAAILLSLGAMGFKRRRIQLPRYLTTKMSPTLSLTHALAHSFSTLGVGMLNTLPKNEQSGSLLAAILMGLSLSASSSSAPFLYLPLDLAPPFLIPSVLPPTFVSALFSAIGRCIRTEWAAVHDMSIIFEGLGHLGLLPLISPKLTQDFLKFTLAHSEHFSRTPSVSLESQLSSHGRDTHTSRHGFEDGMRIIRWLFALKCTPRTHALRIKVADMVSSHLLSHPSVHSFLYPRRSVGNQQGRDSSDVVSTDRNENNNNNNNNNNDIMEENKSGVLTGPDFLVILQAMFNVSQPLPTSTTTSTTTTTTITASTPSSSSLYVVISSIADSDAEVAPHISSVNSIAHAFLIILPSLSSKEILISIQLLHLLGVKAADFTEDEARLIVKLTIEALDICELTGATLSKQQQGLSPGLGLHAEVIQMTLLKMSFPLHNNVQRFNTNTFPTTKAASTSSPFVPINASSSASSHLGNFVNSSTPPILPSIPPDALSMSALSVPPSPATVPTLLTRMTASQQPKSLEMSATSWSNLEQLRATFSTLRPYSLPNTIWNCHRQGFRYAHLKASGVWDLIDATLSKTVHVWEESHPQVAMLLNALTKLNISPSLLSIENQLAIRDALIRQLPSMSPRAVANCIYCVAKLRWPCFLSLPAFQIVVKEAFLRNCVYMVNKGEFPNTLWAIRTLSTDFTFENLKEREKIMLFRAIQALCKRENSNRQELRRSSSSTVTKKSVGKSDGMGRRSGEADNMGTDFGRDVSTIIGALKQMGTTWTQLSQVLPDDSATSFDSSSRRSTTSISPADKVAPSPTPPRSLASILVEMLAGAGQDMDCQSLSLCLFSLGFMGCDWQVHLSAPSRMALTHALMSFLTPFSAGDGDISYVSSKALYWISAGLGRMKVYASDMKSMGRGLVKGKEVNLRRCIVDAYIAHLTSRTLEMRGLASLMKGMHMIRLSPSYIVPHIASTKQQHEDEESRDIVEELTKNLEFAICRLLPSTRGNDMEELLSLVSTLRIDPADFHTNTLLLFINKLVTLIAEQQQKQQPLHQHQRQQKHLLKCFAPVLNTLSHRVNETSDELRIFETLFRFTHTHRRSQILRDLLRTKTNAAGIAKSNPISLVEVLDRKLAPAVSELPPGYLLALLSSFRTLSVRHSDFPASIPPLISCVTSMAATLDGRSLLSLLRSLASLSMRWDMLTSDQQTALAAGAARLLSQRITASRLTSLCSALIALGVTWSEISSRIPIVLRYAVFQLFNDMVSKVKARETLSNRMLEDGGNNYINYINLDVEVSPEELKELLLKMKEMGADAQSLGKKASKAMIQACGLIDPESSLRLARDMIMISDDDDEVEEVH